MVGAKKLIGLALLLLVLPRSQAENGASVVLVYNSSMPASKAVAEHYAAKRQVPSDQIFGFELPQTETISRQDFESKLQEPLWKELRSRNLLTYGPAEEGADARKSNLTAARIRYAVLCYGVPLKITPDAGVKENVESIQQELRRNEAAVDNELAALPLLDKKPLVTGFLGNPVMMTTNSASISPTAGVLMVARIDGPTPEIAKSLVDKAMEAEKNGLWGNAYFDMRSITNAGFKQADDMFKAAAEVTRLYGFEVVTEQSARTFAPTTPLSDIALYFGWYDQSVSGPFTNGMAEFRPGAIAYHLHSFSSRVLRVTDTWWTGPLLNAGATATIGFTEEPYLQTTPQINAFVYRLMHLRFSFGEAAYASLPTLSWQTTIIGDPLYRPFELVQKDRYEQLEANKAKELEWSMLMWVNFRLAQNAPIAEIETYYKDTPLTRQSALLQEKLGDVYKSKGKPLDAIDPYQRALKLPMGSLQKLRLSLKAASMLANLSRAEEAYGIYQEVLREFPNADKKDIYERLAKVAMRLKKTSEAAEFERLAREQKI